MNRLAAVLAFAFIFAAPAAAHDGGDGGGNCRKQVQEACPGLKPGDGKFAACLKDHKDDLSDDCRDKIAAKMHRRGEGKGGACREDAEKVCPGMHPGDGKFGPCMKEHKDELSQGCRRMMAAMMAHRAKKANDGDADG